MPPPFPSIRMRLRLLMLWIVLIAVVIGWLVAIDRISGEAANISVYQNWLDREYLAGKVDLEKKLAAARSSGEPLRISECERELEMWEAARIATLKHIEREKAVPAWKRLLDGLHWFFFRRKA